MASFDAGKISIRLAVCDGRIDAVSVSCRRPDVAAMMKGLRAMQAVLLIPMLYSVCGMAQGIAARVAVAAARGEAPEDRFDPGVAAEAIREHAWKLLVEWPRHFGLAPDEALFVRIVKAAETEARTLRRELTAPPLLAALRQCAAVAGCAPLTESIERRHHDLLGLLAGDHVEAGTGSVRGTPLGQGCGSALVGTARGPLLHEIRLVDDQVISWRIIAPTDRQFADDGPLPGLLVGEAIHDRPQLAEQTVMALDPCVPFDIAAVPAEPGASLQR